MGRRCDWRRSVDPRAPVENGGVLAHPEDGRHLRAQGTHAAPAAQGYGGGLVGAIVGGDVHAVARDEERGGAAVGAGGVVNDRVVGGGGGRGYAVGRAGGEGEGDG